VRQVHGEKSNFSRLKVVECKFKKKKKTTRNCAGGLIEEINFKESILFYIFMKL